MDDEKIILDKDFVIKPRQLCDVIDGVAEDFILLDFFVCVKVAANKHPWLLEVLQCSSWFEDLYTEIHNKCDNPRSDLKYICVASMRDHWEGMVDVFPRLDIWGIGEAQEGGNDGYGIEFTPVNELKHLPIRLETTMVDPLLDERYALPPMRYEPTLLQFIYSILWELTFLGGPQNRSVESEKLDKLVEEIKSGSIKIMKREELIK